jgi:hypothetical protein
MNDSSESSDNPFDHIHLKSIWTLVQLIRDSSTNEMPHIQRRFSEQSLYFDATVHFLRLLGCIVVNESVVTLKRALADRATTEAELSAELVGYMQNRRGPVRVELRRYIRQFQIVANRAIYHPLADHRSGESALRNLLIELSVIRHDASTGEYVLDPRYNGLFTQAARSASPVSLRSVASHRAAAEALGTTAEEAVVVFERGRLGPAYLERVRHIAAVDAAAGYDVESVTVESDGTTLPRVIEVKAVSLGTLRFFWTSNEVAAARRFGIWYFLYLVPIAAGGTPDIDSVRIIRNPCNVVLEAGHGWSVESEVYNCELLGTEGQPSDCAASKADHA